MKIKIFCKVVLKQRYLFASFWSCLIILFNISFLFATTMPTMLANKKNVNSNNINSKLNVATFFQKNEASIDSFSPTMAGIGSTITIKGKGFYGSTSVSFGGKAAQSFTVKSDNEISAVVAGGASGAVVVTTPNGTASVLGFIFLNQPIISYSLPQIGKTALSIQHLNTIKTLNRTVMSQASLLATLSNISVSSGTLNPNFDPNILDYTDTVGNEITSITITPNNTGTATKEIPLNVGTTPIYIVAAGAGAITQTYTVYVTRLSNDPTLSNLITSYGSLDQTFDPTNTEYTQTVNGSTNSITVTPTASYPFATIKVNNQSVSSGTESQSISLNYGNNKITIIVTSQDKLLQQTYLITIFRQSDDATLSSLTPSSGSLKPNFDPATTSYTDTVSNATTSITFTPIMNNPNAPFIYLYVNNQYKQYLYSGNTTQSIPINEGKNIITLQVYAQDYSAQNYTIAVVRSSQSLINDASLTNLIPSQGILSPTFSPTTNTYNISVSNDTSSITLTPTTSNPNATVKVNGVLVSSGNASSRILLKVGKNTITTIVTAPDGVTSQTYTTLITREANHNAALSNLVISNGSLSPSFSSEISSYTANVSNITSSITITPTTMEANAFVTLNGSVINSGNTSGSIPLNVGNNNITIVGIAPDSITTQSYTINVIRAANASSTLSNLIISSGTLNPTFSAAITSYTASVSNSTSNVTVTPTTADANATVKVNGTTVASGSASANIPLTIGINNINIIVTAPDGTSNQTYTISITRVANNNAALNNLVISNGTLSPSFSSSTLNYSTNVSNSISSITITPTTADATATVTVNNVLVNSGSSSASIPLSVGNNTITTIVMAQDGISKQTYTIIVTRAAITLSNLLLSNGTLSPTFSPSTNNYTASVGNTINNITVTPTSTDVNSKITVNDNTVVSGAASGSIPLNVGNNVITTVVTSQDGTTKQTYTVTITRAASSNALLSNLVTSSGTLSPNFSSSVANYTTNVSNTTNSITITATCADPNATITINGTNIVSGIASPNILLTLGSNTVTCIVTAQDGVTTKTYNLIVSKTIGSQTITFNSFPTVIYGEADFSPGAIVNSNLAINYTSSNPEVATIVNNNIHIISAGQTNITAIVQGNSEYFAATPVTQNLVISKAKQIIQVPSNPPLPVVGGIVDLNTFSVNSGLNLSFEVSDPSMASIIGNTLLVNKAGTITLIIKQNGNNNYLATETSYNINTYLPNIVVIPAVTPNGDGIDDYLSIKGLETYPNNTVTLLNRNGAVIYKASGYDNSIIKFDGHSNITNDFQPSGTYIYIVEINNNGVRNHLTGYFVLKY